jgi:hypothetical protein
VPRPRMQGTAGEAEDPAAAWDFTDVPTAPSLKAEQKAEARAARKAAGPPPPAPDRSLVGALRHRVATLLGRR